MTVANLGLRFLLEICALVTLTYGGWVAGGPQLWQRLLLAVLAPLAAGLVWGRWVAPKSDRLLADPLRLVPEWVVFGSATAVLIATGHPLLGAGFAVLAAGNRLVLWRLGSDTDGRVIR
jgi:hypothetical protein